MVSGVCFSDLGNDVICVDKDSEKIEKLKNGIVPIYEPGLNELVKKNFKAKRLSFTSCSRLFLQNKTPNAQTQLKCRVSARLYLGWRTV